MGVGIYTSIHTYTCICICVFFLYLLEHIVQSSCYSLYQVFSCVVGGYGDVIGHVFNDTMTLHHMYTEKLVCAQAVIIIRRGGGLTEIRTSINVCTLRTICTRTIDKILRTKYTHFSCSYLYKNIGCGIIF